MKTRKCTYKNFRIESKLYMRSLTVEERPKLSDLEALLSPQRAHAHLELKGAVALYEGALSV